MTPRPMPDASLLDSPLAGAEFLAVDTETNGQPRERCELTEVGAVLVGGGELHDRWSSLVGVSEPLGRGIQRFTGITPGDGRRGAAAGGGAAGARRAPARARARRPLGAVRRRGAAAGVRARRARVARAARAVHDRARAPVRARCSAGAAWPRWPTRSGSTSRPPTARCPTRRRARACCARCCRGWPPTRGRWGRGWRCSAPAGRPGQPAAGRAAPARRAAGPLRAAQGSRRVHLPRRRRAAAVRRQVGLPAHPRAGALHDSGGVDGRGRARRLPADGVRARRARAREPPDQGAQAAGQHAAQAGGGRLRVPALPARHRLPDPRGGARAGGRQRRLRRARCAAGRRPPSWSSSSTRCSACATAAAGSRAAQHPSAYGQMGRCLSPCLGDLDPNLYRERLDAALGLFVSGDDGGAALLAHVDAQMRAAAAAQRYERAAWLRRRARRLESLLRRLGGVLRATHTGARLVVAPHPATPERADAFWIVGGRIADWGPLPADGVEVAARTAHALARRRRPPGWAAGFRRPSSTRCGSSARGWPATRTRRCWSCGRPRRRGGVHRPLDGFPPQDSTESGPSGSRSCTGAGLVAGAARRSSATTWVTGRPVKRATRCGKSCWSHFDERPGSVHTNTSSWREGSKCSATRVHRVGVTDHAAARRGPHRACP